MPRRTGLLSTQNFGLSGIGFFLSQLLLQFPLAFDHRLQGSGSLRLHLLQAVGDVESFIAVLQPSIKALLQVLALRFELIHFSDFLREFPYDPEAVEESAEVSVAT